jgi:hypothetical protein
MSRLFSTILRSAIQPNQRTQEQSTELAVLTLPVSETVPCVAFLANALL